MTPNIHRLGLATLLAATTLSAQPTPKVAPPELDKLASETLAKWQKLRYQLEGEGITSIHFDIAVESKGGMTGTWKATGKYRYENDPKHPYGVLTWEDDEIRAAMQRRGWTAEALARDIRTHSTLMTLANRKVSGQQQKNGTILVVSGGQEDRFLLFDRGGVQAGEIVGPMKKRIRYQEYRGKFLRVGESYAMPDTLGEIQIEHDTVRGVLVATKLVEKVQVRNRLLSDLRFTFKNHKLTKAAPTSKPSRTTKATGSPEALALAARVQGYAGGAAALAKVRSIAFTTSTTRRLFWDRAARKVRIESMAAAPAPRTRGRFTAVMVHDLATRKDLLTVPEPPRQAPRVSGYSSFANDTYSLLIAFKVLDPGTRLSILPATEDAPAGVAQLQLTFAQGTGTSDRNRHILHVEKDTGRIRQWDFYRTERTRNPRSWKFEDYQQVGDLRLALTRRGVGPRSRDVSFHRIESNVDMPKDIWTRKDRYLYEAERKRQTDKKTP